VPNYLVDFFFYVPNAAQTHSQKKKKISGPVFLQGSYFTHQKCVSVTKQQLVLISQLYLWEI